MTLTVLPTRRPTGISGLFLLSFRLRHALLVHQCNMRCIEVAIESGLGDAEGGANLGDAKAVVVVQ